MFGFTTLFSVLFVRLTPLGAGGKHIDWQVISQGNWSGGKGCSSTYFGRAFRNRLCNIWRDYNLKNLICIREQED